jgi:hypothetical protein
VVISVVITVEIPDADLGAGEPYGRRAAAVMPAGGGRGNEEVARPLYRTTVVA